MPYSSTVIIIRHAEKSNKKKTLSKRGLCRSYAYIQYFNPLEFEGEKFTPDHIYATASTHQSLRPTETVELLALQLKLEIHNKFHEHEIKELVKHLSDKHFTSKNILICWHHGMALDLAKEFGVQHNQLTESNEWPKVWDDSDFGKMLIIRFDEKGNVEHSKTYSKNQQLMATDLDATLDDEVF